MHCARETGETVVAVCVDASGMSRALRILTARALHCLLCFITVCAEDRVCGTIDIEKALTEGVKAFEPGLLAKANRGILYVDEVGNCLMHWWLNCHSSCGRLLV
jgi:hypothetical protein